MRLDVARDVGVRQHTERAEHREAAVVELLRLHLLELGRAWRCNKGDVAAELLVESNQIDDKEGGKDDNTG